MLMWANNPPIDFSDVVNTLRGIANTRHHNFVFSKGNKIPFNDIEESNKNESGINGFINPRRG